MQKQDSEQHRHELECREWLARGYTTKVRVDALIERIAKIRGRDAAEKLRQGMREELMRQRGEG